MALYSIFAHDGEHTFQENFDVPDGTDPVEAGVRHLAKAWGFEVTTRASIAQYVDSLDEFSVELAEADEAVLGLIDATAAFLAGSRDDAALAVLRTAYDGAAPHREHYEAA